MSGLWAACHRILCSLQHLGQALVSLNHVHCLLLFFFSPYRHPQKLKQLFLLKLARSVWQGIDRLLLTLITVWLSDIRFQACWHMWRV
jgi:hypothetical protein